MHYSKSLILGSVILLLLGIHCVSSGLKRTPADFISEPDLASAVNATDVERFPGEGELMKALNHSAIRSTIHVYQGKRYADDPGFYYLNPPAFYGETDFLQLLQDQGLDAYALINSDPQLRETLKQHPETYRKLRDLGWLE